MAVGPAERAIGFIESLPQTKGRWAGQPLELMDWQREALTELFGTLDENGHRQYRTTFWFVPRKNGKSSIAAAVALYLLFADREPGAEVYGAAYDREQASIVFDQALAMLAALEGNTKEEGTNPVPWRAYKREKRIEVPSTNAKYEAIPAVAAGSHGYNASGIIFDEFHTQRDRELWDVLTTSTDTREQPLVFVITTAGVEREGPCFKEYEYAKKVEDGVIEDDSYLPVVFEASEPEDWQEPEQWSEANPGLDYTIPIERLASKCRKAEQQPEFENTFKRLHLNLWVSNEAKVIGAEQWRACRGEVSEYDLEGMTCYGGLDLASKIDVAACLWVFEGDRPIIVPRFWVPEATIDERTRKDGVPYRTWARQGHLTATEGTRIDYGAIREQIIADADRFDVQEVAFDPWGANQLTQELMDLGLTMVEVRQGYKSMSEPTKELLAMVRDAELLHGGNPVLRWMADNLVTTEDPAGNIKPAKNKSREKIDGMVALVMALDRLIRHGSQGSSYNDPDKELLVL